MVLVLKKLCCEINKLLSFSQVLFRQFNEYKTYILMI